ncbi:MAG: PhoH family protein [Candidatus Kapabacteria bacterium]|nr:PhoH family protein [Candidatus Kapabacteria bacterium]
MEITERRVVIESPYLVNLFGANDRILSLIDNRFNSSIVVRGNVIIIKGEIDELNAIESIFKELSYMIEKNGIITEMDVESTINLVAINNNNNENFSVKNKNNIIYNGYKNVIRARTARQIEYFAKVSLNDMVFSIGPAGTGKTFLAVAMALASLKNNEVSKIILTRPAVEAGESLGFLPGDMAEKIDPYLRPLVDAIQSMVNPDKYKVMKEKNTIEINPLAYMRGRTLSNAFIILDEAQNTTRTQMKMFLTRLGEGSKAIITGDVTQIDLKNRNDSGLVEAQKILKNIKGIDFVEFDKGDVVRHRLVAEIINAYEKSYKTEEDDNKTKVKNK